MLVSQRVLYQDAWSNDVQWIPMAHSKKAAPSRWRRGLSFPSWSQVVKPMASRMTCTTSWHMAAVLINEDATATLSFTKSKYVQVLVLKVCGNIRNIHQIFSSFSLFGRKLVGQCGSILHSQAELRRRLPARKRETTACRFSCAQGMRWYEVHIMGQLLPSQHSETERCFHGFHWFTNSAHHFLRDCWPCWMCASSTTGASSAIRATFGTVSNESCWPKSIKIHPISVFFSPASSEKIEE